VWPVLFTEAAGAELIDAQDWYEAQAPGLGRRFRAEIDSVVQRMADNPRQFPVVFKTLRRARAKKFPYALFFLIEPDALSVVACFIAAAIRASGKSASNFYRALLTRQS
jgi:plasmid stabilization system protein ParE